jgi:cyclase
MLRSRITPCLLIHNGELVKTQQFKSPKYVGDPLNAVRIFNEKEVDEIIVLDIDATREGREPNLELIRELAAECRMPLCYGGGVTRADQAALIIGLGVEKVAVSAAAIENSTIVSEMATVVGRQSVVVVLDVKKSLFGKYHVYTRNGSTNTKLDPVEVANQMEKLGAGEIVLNSIDNDGMMKGYDLELAQRVRDAIDLPMTILGGAGKLEDLRAATERFKLIGTAAGSFFVFKGKYRAVLISYPTGADKNFALGR